MAHNWELPRRLHAFRQQLVYQCERETGFNDCELWMDLDGISAYLSLHTNLNSKAPWEWDREAPWEWDRVQRWEGGPRAAVALGRCGRRRRPRGGSDKSVLAAGAAAVAAPSSHLAQHQGPVPGPRHGRPRRVGSASRGGAVRRHAQPVPPLRQHHPAPDLGEGGVDVAPLRRERRRALEPLAALCALQPPVPVPGTLLRGHRRHRRVPVAPSSSVPWATSRKRCESTPRWSHCP